MTEMLRQTAATASTEIRECKRLVLVSSKGEEFSIFALAVAACILAPLASGGHVYAIFACVRTSIVDFADGATSLIPNSSKSTSS